MSLSLASSWPSSSACSSSRWPSSRCAAPAATSDAESKNAQFLGGLGDFVLHWFLWLVAPARHRARSGSASPPTSTTSRASPWARPPGLPSPWAGSRRAAGRSPSRACATSSTGASPAPRASPRATAPSSTPCSTASSSCSSSSASPSSLRHTAAGAVARHPGPRRVGARELRAGGGRVARRRVHRRPHAAGRAAGPPHASPASPTARSRPRSASPPARVLLGVAYFIGLAGLLTAVHRTVWIAGQLRSRPRP